MIIGFSGLARSGKTTCSSYILEKYSGMFEKVNFKDGLIKELKQNFPDLLAEIDNIQNDLDGIDSLFDRKPTLMRALMQNYGTEVRRGDNERYWIDKWNKAVSNIGKNVVVDDVRFLNEADAVKLAGGIIIRIKRTDIQEAGNHVSETELDSIIPDHEIEVGPGEHQKIYDQLDEIISKHI